MSATRNDESMVNQGEFSSRVPPSEPLTTKGHKPGVKVGNDAAPEFSAQAHPPGTAPREHTFTPNPDPQSEIPGQAAHLHNPDAGAEETRADPLDFPGATSGTVHNETTFGRPAHGQTAQERHHAGIEGRVQTGGGYGGGGGGGGGGGVETGDGSVERKVRGLGADLEGRAGEQKGQRGASGASEGGVSWTGAEERVPVGAEEVAAERPEGGHAGVASSERA